MGHAGFGVLKLMVEDAVAITGEPRHLSVPHLFNPPCRLHQPIFPGDIELRGSPVPIEAVPLGALF